MTDDHKIQIRMYALDKARGLGNWNPEQYIANARKLEEYLLNG